MFDPVNVGAMSGTRIRTEFPLLMMNNTSGEGQSSGSVDRQSSGRGCKRKGTSETCLMMMPETGNGKKATISSSLVNVAASISSKSHPRGRKRAPLRGQSFRVGAGVCGEHHFEFLDGYRFEFTAIQNLGIDYLAHLLQPLASSSPITTGGKNEEREADRKITHTSFSPFDQEDETTPRESDLDETEEKLYAAMVADEEDACAKRYKSFGVVHKNSNDRHADSAESTRLTHKFRQYEKGFRRRINHKHFSDDSKMEPLSGQVVDVGTVPEKFVLKESREPPSKKYEELSGITWKRRRERTKNFGSSIHSARQ